MPCMPDMTPTSLVVAVASCTGKIIKNGLRVFERERWYYILHFLNRRKTDFSERGLALKKLI